MTDERYTFEAARVRLEEIATLARKKDTSLEKSLDLLEEGVRLANICTELVDHSATVAVEMPDELPAEVGPVEAVAEPADDAADDSAGPEDTAPGHAQD
jgi:exodeoxyribonuclease VII small subunit